RALIRRFAPPSPGGRRTRLSVWANRQPSSPSPAAVDWERHRVFLRIGRVEYAVEERLFLHVLELRRHAHIFHCVQVHVLPHHLAYNSCVIRRRLHHSPAAELAQPPQTKRL